MTNDLFKHKRVNQYDSETTKQLWRKYPALMLQRFKLCMGLMNGTIEERLLEIMKIDIVVAPVIKGD